MNTTQIRTGGADFAKGELDGGWAEYDCPCGETVRAEGQTFQQARARLVAGGVNAHVRANIAAHR